MKKIKKWLFRIVCLAMLSAMCMVHIIAAESFRASLSFEQNFTETSDRIIAVTISVTDITDEKGLDQAQFDVHFDPDELEFISAENKTPSGWDFSGSVQEDWSYLEKESSVYHFQQFSPLENDAVKDNGEFQVILRFKAKSFEVKKSLLKIDQIRYTNADLSSITCDDMEYTLDYDPENTAAIEEPEDNILVKALIIGGCSIAIIGTAVAVFLISRKKRKRG